MRFSVIVPFLNEERYLRRCIDALLNQSIPSYEYELIFIDNGSTDRSREILDQYPQIISLFEPIKDAYVARNRGIKAARGEIVLFTDADCEASSTLLEVYDLAFRDQSIDIAVGRLSFPLSRTSLLKYYEDYYATKMRLMATELPRETCYGHAGNMAARAKLFDSLGLFSSMPIVGDAEIVQKYLDAFPERRMAYLDGASVTHLEVGSSLDLLRKLYRYGVYSHTFSRKSSFRVANMQEKLRTLSECINEHRYSPLKSLELLAALSTHYLAFATGCFRARFVES